MAEDDPSTMHDPNKPDHPDKPGKPPQTGGHPDPGGPVQPIVPPDDPWGPEGSEGKELGPLGKYILHKGVLKLVQRHKNKPDKKPNILVIFGDDIGVANVSAYNLGITGWRTPNIDRIAQEGALFTDAYGEQSCTAGRCAFLMGQSPFRVGLLTIGLPGQAHGIPDNTVTIADLLQQVKVPGPAGAYRTAQFGKNHLGDMNRHLPTVHGFDEFYGTLYHLNTGEEQFNDYYPKDPEFLKKFGPRGVMDCKAGKGLGGERDSEKYGPVGDQVVKDTGPLPPERMKGLDDDEVLPRAVSFIRDCVRHNDKFFCWVNASRIHVNTYLKDSSKVTGCGPAADAMVEHDKFVGVLLDTLKKEKIDDDTIVIYTTDNGAELFLWPDGGLTQFHGEKGTTWEGGLRIPFLMKWPGVIDPGSIINELFSLQDCLPTLMAAVGDDNVVERLKTEGFKHERRNKVKIHLDGYNFMPFFLGQEKEGPRKSFFYWSQAGQLNAVRYGDWKASFATQPGNFLTATRTVTAWASVTNLRMDPYERNAQESGAYARWFVDTAPLFYAIGDEINKFISTIPGEWEYQPGNTWGPQDINYNTLALKGFAEQMKEQRFMGPGKD